MDCLQQARILYGECHRQGNALSQEKQASISTAISKLIRTSLLQQGGSASFRYLPFTHIIQRTVGANRFHGDRAAMAFLTLEKYLVLLAQQPWKREFWVLKLYGGYFCTKVRAHLEEAEQILQLIGFLPEEGATVCQRLVLHEAPDNTVALNVAFDCQVASQECQYIEEYHSTMKCVGLDLTDAMNVLLSGASNTLLVGSSLPGDLERSSGVLGNMKISYNPSSVPADMLSTGRSQGAVKSHTILASGGMGMGVVTGVKSMHQVIGVQPSHHASSAGGATTHQVIGVSATHCTAGMGPFQATRVASSGVHPPTEAHMSAPASAAMRGSSAMPGVGHSVLHVTGVPASHPQDPASRKMNLNPPHNPHALAHHLLAPGPTPTPTPAPHHDPPYSCPADARQPAEPLTVIFPQHQSSPLVGETSGRPSLAVSHPPSVSYQPPGYRPSYASSAYGSGSGSASVMSGGSSACTGSSGYCSATSSSPSHDYANLPLKPPGESTVDSTSFLSRPARPTQKPQFAFIEEDETGLGAPFPEATHEEHLRESLRNLQVSQADKPQKRALSKNISPQLVGHSDGQGMGGSDAVPVPFDDWRWFRGGTDKALSSACKVDGEERETKVHPAPVSIQPSAAMRPTSVPTAILPSNAMATNVDMARVDLSHPAVAQDAWKATVTPNPVYYPPAVVENLYENSPSLVKGPPPHSHASPILTRKMTTTTTTTSARWEERVPQTHRPRATPSPPSPIYNNLDRTPQLKVLNVLPDNNRATFDAVKRDTALSKGRGRASSLGTTTHYANLVDLSGRESHLPYSLDGTVSSPVWTCGTCTMVNRAGDGECQACGRSCGAPETLFSVAGESRRVCPSCTFENPPGCRSCEVCEVLLPQDVHTYV